MLMWTHKPHPWFQEFVRWSLARAITEIDAPAYLSRPPFSDSIGIRETDDDVLVAIFGEMLSCSLMDHTYRLTAYQFSLMYRVLRWSLRTCGRMNTSALLQMRGMYMPGTDYLALCAAARPEHAEIRMAWDPPCHNPRSSTDEMAAVMRGYRSSLDIPTYIHREEAH